MRGEISWSAKSKLDACMGVQANKDDYNLTIWKTIVHPKTREWTVQKFNSFVLEQRQATRKKNKEELKAQRESLDLIGSTVNIPLNWKRYVSALRPHGVLSFVGAVAEPVSIHTGTGA